MKIVFSNYDDTKNPCYGGGGAYAVHDVAKRLAKKNSVIVYTGKYPGGKDERIDGVNYKRIGSNILGARLGQLFFVLALPIEVIKGGFDVWVESFTPPFSTSCLQLFTKKPVVGLVHMLSGGDMGRKYKLPFKLIENIGLKTYKRFIVLSENSKQAIRKQNKVAEISIISNGININMRKSKRDSHILSIGRIEIDQKGLDLLLDAFGRAEIDSKVKLVIAGNGEKKEISKLQGKIKELNLESRVKLAGRVSGKRKTKLFEDCMFVVLPSRYETQSLVALEAISCGAALVCFDIDGNKWLPDNICAKVKAFDVVKLSQTMEELVKDFGKRNRLGVGAKEFAKIYSWDKVAKRYEQYLLTLTNKA